MNEFPSLPSAPYKVIFHLLPQGCLGHSVSLPHSSWIHPLTKFDSFALPVQENLFDFSILLMSLFIALYFWRTTCWRKIIPTHPNTQSMDKSTMTVQVRVQNTAFLNLTADAITERNYFKCTVFFIKAFHGILDCKLLIDKYPIKYRKHGVGILLIGWAFHNLLYYWW